MKKFLEIFFSFHGRLSRRAWWARSAVIWLVILIPVIFGTVHLIEMMQRNAELAKAIETQNVAFLQKFFSDLIERHQLIFGGFSFFSFAVYLSRFSLAVRRFHDLNLSAFHALMFSMLTFIPTIAPIAAIVQFVILGFVPGYKGRNMYGVNPKFSTEKAELAAESEEAEVKPEEVSPYLLNVRNLSTKEEKLAKLKSLFDRGFLSEEEYSNEMQRIVDGL